MPQGTLASIPLHKETEHTHQGHLHHVFAAQGTGSMKVNVWFKDSLKQRGGETFQRLPSLLTFFFFFLGQKREKKKKAIQIL